MKRLRTLAVGTAFLIGIPLCLIAIEQSPFELFSRFAVFRQINDPELFIRSGACFILWAVWLFGTTSVIMQAVTLKRYGIIEPSDQLFKKAAAAFVVTLWLISAHSASKSTGNEQEAKSAKVENIGKVQEPQSNYQTFMPSTFALMSLLSLIESSHRRKLQLSSGEMHDEPASKRSQMYWSQLLYKASVWPLSRKPQGRLSVPTCVVATMNENGFVTDIDRSGKCKSAVVTIPLGKVGAETALLSIGANDEISIHPIDQNAADEIILYLNCFLSLSSARTKSVHRGHSDSSSIQISQTHDGWKIEPSDVYFSPFVIKGRDAEIIGSLQSDLSKPLVRKPIACTISEVADWRICVRIMGPVEIANKSWETLRFERSKSAELLTWLVMHRDRPTRIAARTALWGVSIEDSTFNNVVSGVRKVINQNGQNLLERESNDVFRVGFEVITDAEILEAAIVKVKLKSGEEEFQILREALDLVRDLPFAGEDFVWADTEGITSNIVLTIITGALMLSDFYMSKQDLDGVFWATGKGLKALRGHEALISLRMKAHAQERNISGINSEWLAYERLRIAEDQFLDRESNEIAKLRESLLTNI
jgi:hypothetical protein